MTFFDALILGVVQGLTEFLPVSSSGHLVLAHHLLGYHEPDIFFDVICHVGTLVAVIVYYFGAIRSLAVSAIDFRQPESSVASISFWRNNKGRAYLLAVVLASIPTGLIGILFKDSFESLFSNPFLVGFALLFTTIAVFSTRWSVGRARGDLSFAKSVILGFAQGLAIAPGISRSGTTIATALALGIEKKKAAQFSFLVSIPAILGAVVLKGKDVDFASVDWVVLSTGFIASLLVGLACLVLLIKLVEKGKFHWFAAYTLPVAIFALWI